MRLLNTKTLQIEEFLHVEGCPTYAILSHTWEKEEVSFKAISDLESSSQLLGFSKIKGCCEQAARDGYGWVWIDTCCIDKSSSAELSEAINSMYNWYKRAAVCYAYLADVAYFEDVDAPDCELVSSRWFMRGWTLQELIAPCEVIFLSRDWKEVGSRTTLSTKLSEITKIHKLVLTDKSYLHDQSIAQRMSWASRRSTTRPEDEAYCLMGLFDINMPLLYGEGKKAFLRLQEEILKRSNDHTLFAWACKLRGMRLRILSGLLAESPSDFEDSGDYVQPVGIALQYGVAPYSMTNMGLCITLPMFMEEGAGWIAILNTSSTSDPSQHRLGIYLQVSSLNTVQNTTYYNLESMDGFRNARKPPKSFLVRTNPDDSLVLVSSSGNELLAKWATLYIQQLG